MPVATPIILTALHFTMAESQHQETPMIVVENEEAGTQKETNVIITSSTIEDNTKGILKKRGRIITPEERWM